MQQLPIDIAIEKYINAHRACSSARTVDYYIENLTKFSTFINGYNIIYCDEININMFMDYVLFLRNKGIKNTSVNTYCRAVRAWCSWLIENNYIVCSFVSSVKKLRDDSNQIFPLTLSDVEAIDNYIAAYMNAERNYIIFHLLLECGLRRQEVINLNRDDINYCCIVINNSKYNKSRLVPLPEHLYYRIVNYCNSSGPLLIDRYGKRITNDCIKKIFLNISKNVIKVNPHKLRHTFATSYIMGGGNLEFLRILLGHSSYDVTQKYLHVAAQCMIADVDIYRLDKCFFKNYNNGGY